MMTRTPTTRLLAATAVVSAALLATAPVHAGYRFNFDDAGNASYAFYDYQAGGYDAATSVQGVLRDGLLTYVLPTVRTGPGEIAIAPAGAAVCDAASCVAGLRFLDTDYATPGEVDYLQFVEPAGNGSQAATGFPTDYAFGFAVPATSSTAFTFAAGDGSYANTNFYNGTITPAGAGAGGVPEPASWALMLAGFGLVGTALRRRPRGYAAG